MISYFFFTTFFALPPRQYNVEMDRPMVAAVVVRPVVVRAAISLTAVVVGSVLARLYVGSMTSEGLALHDIMVECERVRRLAGRMHDRPLARAKHLGVCVGLCNAARAMASDAAIEEATAIHVASYLDRLNVALQNLLTDQSVSPPPPHQTVRPKPVDG